MKYEVIKKDYKGKVFIVLSVVIIILLVINFMTTRAKYKEVQIFNIVRGKIHYNPSDLNILAMYVDETEEVQSVPKTSDGYYYKLNRSVCTVNGTQDDTIQIKYNTNDGELRFLNLQKGTKCTLYFDKYEKSPEATLVLLHNLNSTIPETVTSERSSFSSASTSSDAAIYRIADPMYTKNNVTPYSYYWYGAVKNNWFKYGGHMWRIIRINGDGTLRLLYTGTISSGNTMTNVTTSGVTVSGNGSAINSTSSTYQGYRYAAEDNVYKNPAYVGWTYSLVNSSGYLRPTSTVTSSYAKTQIESWMADKTRGNLDGDTNIVAGKFCNDRSTTSSVSTSGLTTSTSTFYYGAYGRLNGSSPAPSLGCGTYGTTSSNNNTDDGNANRANLDIYETRYGLITADEVALAGGKNGSSNSTYYLYSGQTYWTMSPYFWYSSGAYVFGVISNGNLSNDGVNNTRGLRPVINLSPDNLIISGRGLYNNPFYAIS